MNPSFRLCEKAPGSGYPVKAICSAIASVKTFLAISFLSKFYFSRIIVKFILVNMSFLIEPFLKIATVPPRIVVKIVVKTK